jgi:dTMP kinase
LSLIDADSTPELKATMPGLFLSLDGIDGTGKSTQGRLLSEWLLAIGARVTTCIDPGGTPIGAALRNIVLDHRQDISLPCEALVFMASRAELVARVIRPALAENRVVICDRFQLANVVYQGYGGGLPAEELWSIGRFATGGLAPDLTLVFDLPIEVAAERRDRQPDRLERRDRDYHERVRQGYLLEASRQPERIRVIDASGSIELVHQLVRTEVLPLLPSELRNVVERH